MKRVIALILAILLLAALGACGGKAEPVAPQSEEASAQTEESILPQTETPTAPPEEGSGTPAVQEAWAPEEGAVYLAFSGDSHGETDTYGAWLAELKGTFGQGLAYVGYSGDICDKSWDPEVFSQFQQTLDEAVPGLYGVTTGNQEWKSGAPGPDWDSLGDGFVRSGVAVQTERYIVYHLGAASEDMAFDQGDLEDLAAFLEQAPKDIPLFILSHYPLHDFVKADIAGGGYRCCRNSGDVIDLLNGYPNVIFLWGHNHSFADPRYGTIRLAGEQLTYSYAEPTAKKEIAFTYANYGCFCRGSRFGLVAQLSEDGSVTLSYFGAAWPDTTRDSAQLSFGPDGVTGTLVQGSGISEADILLYSGYPDDPDFVSAY